MEGLKDLHADPHMLHDVTASACAAELELAKIVKRGSKSRARGDERHDAHWLTGASPALSYPAVHARYTAALQGGSWVP